MRNAQAPQHVIDSYRAKVRSAVITSADEDRLDLWPEHELPVQALFACDTQWRVASTMGGVVFLGLDYAACDVSLKAHGLTMTPESWKDFRVLESAATSLRNGTRPEALLAGEQLP